MSSVGSYANTLKETVTSTVQTTVESNVSVEVSREYLLLVIPFEYVMWTAVEMDFCSLLSLVLVMLMWSVRYPI